MWHKIKDFIFGKTNLKMVWTMVLHKALKVKENSFLQEKASSYAHICTYKSLGGSLL